MLVVRFLVFVLVLVRVIFPVLVVYVVTFVLFGLVPVDGVLFVFTCVAFLMLLLLFLYRSINHRCRLPSLGI